MSLAKLTIRGFHNYSDGHIWDELTLPEGMEKDVLVNTILWEFGEDEVMHPDPEALKFAIGLWGIRWRRTLERWIKALDVEYDPLDNYNRLEHWTDSPDITETSDSSTSASMSGSGRVESNGSNSSTNNDTTTTARNTYDSDTFHDTDKVVDSSSSGSTDSNVTSTTNTDSQNATATVINSTVGTTTHDGRVHGNIGVTTSAQMLVSDIDANRFNLYNEASELFARELLIDSFF